jgi:hypothetical protein
MRVCFSFSDPSILHHITRKKETSATAWPEEQRYYGQRLGQAMRPAALVGTRKLPEPEPVQVQYYGTPYSVQQQQPEAGSALRGDDCDDALEA